jgi:transcription elongation GreA/GreB family factor
MFLSEFNDENIVAAFLGKQVGDVFSVKFGKEDHEVTLIGVRTPGSEEEPK